jgi:hypothetical protein
MKRLSDTSPEAERVLMDVFRRMPPGQKWLQLGKTYRDGRALHAAGFRYRHPSATRRQIHEDWMRVHLGFTLLDKIREPAVDIQCLRDLRAVTDVFVRLQVPYAVGGSVASSVFGIDRYTRDADITVEPFPGKETELVAAFGPEWYVSLAAVQEAIRQRSTFNIINTSSGYKVDVFIRKDEAFEQSALARRCPLPLPDAPGQQVYLHAPEDIVLFKLRWYRLGNESSEQQWKDVLGVLQVQAGKLDEGYLDRWAMEIGVADLLARARAEIGSGI